MKSIIPLFSHFLNQPFSLFRFMYPPFHPLDQISDIFFWLACLLSPLASYLLYKIARHYAILLKKDNVAHYSFYQSCSKGELCFVGISPLLIVLWAGFYTEGFLLMVSICLGWLLVFLSFMDGKFFLLPDFLTLLLLILGLLVTWLFSPTLILWHVIAVLLGFSSLFLLHLFYLYIKKKHAIGLGDAKLLAAAGAWVGLEGLTSVLLIACFFGLSYGLILSFLSKSLYSNTKIPFGIFLAFGLWIVWIYGSVRFYEL